MSNRKAFDVVFKMIVAGSLMTIAMEDIGRFLSGGLVAILALSVAGLIDALTGGDSNE